MHINWESDYAVRLVQRLAQLDQKTDAKTLAEHTDVSLRFTLKIMQKLVSGGIVQSFKGAKGGYTLSRPAADITLRQVIEAVEGPYQFSRCHDGTQECQCTSSGGRCPFQSVFDDITRTVIDKMDTVTFDQLI